MTSLQSTQRLRLLLALAHPPTRDTVRRLVADAPDLQIVAETSNGEMAVTICQHQPIDLLITELALYALDGISVSYMLRRSHRLTPVLLLSSSSDARVLLSAMQANVTGYIRHTPLDETFIGMLHTVAGGSVVVDQQLAATGVIHLAHHSGQPDLKPWLLDALDRSIIARLGQEVSMTKIANSLALPPHRLYARIQRICRKFGVRQRADLLSYAAEFGLLTSGVAVD